MVRPLSLSQLRLYVVFLGQGADDLFDWNLLENGSVSFRSGRASAMSVCAHYQGYTSASDVESRSRRFGRYLGRGDDPKVVAMIARFQRMKAV